MIKINVSERKILNKLCELRSNDDMLCWFLEGNPYCDAWVDNKEQPDEAIIIVADFCYLLGEVRNPDEVKKVLEENAHYKIIIPCGPWWVTYLNEYLGEKISCFQRYAFKEDPKSFDKHNLNQLIERIDPVYVIKKIDQNIYNEVVAIDWAADGCCYFGSYENFEKKGLGYVVYKEEQLVCIASSYTAINNKLWITIGTLEEHRRKGLAAACAATLILDCLERDIYPAWEAANMDSVALAKKLGYQFDKAFDGYSIV